MAVAANDHVATIDGGAVETDGASFPMGTDIDTFFLGANQISLNQLDGYMARIAIYNTRLDDATLEEYTLNGLPEVGQGMVYALTRSLISTFTRSSISA
jgi:hypothetical protein